MSAAEPLSTDTVCGSRTKRGGTCGLPSGWGTNHIGAGRCKFHGGNTPGGRKQGARIIAAHLADELDVEPDEALLWMVRAAAGEVAYLTGRVAELQEQELLVRQQREREWSGMGENGTAGGFETTTSTATDLHVWVRARQDAMDRLARFAKLALDQGIAERRVRAMEYFADQFTAAIRGIFGELAPELLERPETDEVIHRHLLALEAGGPG